MLYLIRDMVLNRTVKTDTLQLLWLVLTASLNLIMIQCYQPAAAITVSYKPSVQQVSTS